MAMRRFFTPRWIIATLFVAAAVAVMLRLGFWQLDRLAQRRASNADIQAQVDAPPLALNSATVQPDDLLKMEYRQATVTGVFDPANQVILRNAVLNDLPGYRLLTPFKIAGTNQAVLVDRGFIPLEDKTPADWAKYDRPGTLTLSGVLRLGHVPQLFGVADPPLAPGQTRLPAWNNLNLPRIAAQMPYALLPVYLQQSPDTPATAKTPYPAAATDQPDLSEGPHMGYAIQWFAFAATAALVFIFYARKQLGNTLR